MLNDSKPETLLDDIDLINTLSTNFWFKGLETSNCFSTIPFLIGKQYIEYNSSIPKTYLELKYTKLSR